MSHQTSRRHFLRGGFNRPAVMRPLGALAPMTFEDTCTKCGDCARACPEGIIFRDDEGFPVINLRRGECTFCNACVEACEPAALVAGTTWDWRAGATDQCLSKTGVQCRTCEDHCDARAIRFKLLVGGRSEPVFDKDACTGCGACAAPCPVNAIHFTHISQPKEDSTC
ncbi:ferredoxin-type protein NapF [Shimia thalassica]|uniref:ferredoxin-type protein NapF n=1 Tax=Shimia thalassica TaxID=1715693 RepID=UPI0026E3D404|nr:ferredoxin-type protein NapF [Shimia thalassica]MDO6479961.1 ferredoxin-type protein NapF [Shimia thalassica]